MRSALVLTGFLVFLVVLAYCFASAERRAVIGECFQHAADSDQQALCRAISPQPLKGSP